MKNFNYLFYIIVFIFYFSTINAKNNNSSIEFDKFNKYFETIDTLTFNFPELIIGDISELITLNDHIIVFIDPIAGAAIWIDLKQKKFKKLCVDKNMPGYNFHPSQLNKDPIEGFWVSSYPNLGEYFKFDKNGNLKKIFAQPERMIFDRFFIDSYCNIISIIRTKENNINFIKYDTKTGKTKKLFNISTKFKNSICRIDGGGFFLDSSNIIYYSNPVENKIYKYTMDGELLKTIYPKKSKFKQLKNDFPESKTAVISMLKNKKVKYDIVLKIQPLNRNIIVMLYAIDLKPHFDIFYKNGDVLNKEAIRSPRDLLFSENNVIYLKSQPDKLNKDGELANPVVIRYKLKEENIK